jgi:HSP90 family molecular chaperone
MILEKQKNSEVLEAGEVSESIGMSLDLDSADFLMQMLSKNIYQDPIGSLVREYASNALDSHRRCNVDDPIIVSFGVVNSNFEFSVQDFGCGLSKDEFMTILGKYGKSTKRESKNELGMFGRVKHLCRL